MQQRLPGSGDLGPRLRRRLLPCNRMQLIGDGGCQGGQYTARQRKGSCGAGQPACFQGQKLVAFFVRVIAVVCASEQGRHSGVGLGLVLCDNIRGSMRHGTAAGAVKMHNFSGLLGLSKALLTGRPAKLQVFWGQGLSGLVTWFVWTGDVRCKPA